ncbi:hypothetical protein [Paenibacillus sp. 481]|uniref:hypothetical protein n=1 Tax=Paenibacillus sp. 481 TaxID=2835869 RepID=UPI001E3011EE|nr:hypothetical protein [Paenibacillus sp. 481]UHA75623.1 hypothetical protein KIK04_11880 [Paenibacillus sp. 481]
MNKKLVALLVASLLVMAPQMALAGSFKMLNQQHDIGDIFGSATKALIDEYEIPLYEHPTGGKVLLKDLAQYGFDIHIGDNDTQFVRVKRIANKDVEGVVVPAVAVGSKIGDLQASNWSVQLGNRAVVSYLIKGSTAINFKDLSVFGDIQYDATAKTLQLTLNNESYEGPAGVELKLEAVKNNTEHLIKEAQVVHFFYHAGKKQVRTEKETVRHIESGKEVKFDNEATWSKYKDEMKHIFYMGASVEHYKDHEMKVVSNPQFEQDSTYYKTKYKQNLTYYVELDAKLFQQYLDTEFKKNKYGPIKITRAIVEQVNDANVKQAVIDHINLSHKTVKSFEVALRFYDKHNKLVTEKETKYESFFGVVNNGDVARGDRGRSYWELMTYSNAVVKMSVEVTKVVYQDGTVWKSK